MRTAPALAVLLLTAVQAQADGQRVEPHEIMKGLLGIPEQRANALRTLGLAPESSIGSARLTLVQMDADAEWEAVLEIDAGLSRVVRVYDKAGEGWLETGRWDAPIRQDVELREIVTGGAKDLVLRVAGTGCGGGYCASGISVWHMHKGRLVEVFSSDEQVTTLCTSESTTVQFPISEEQDRGYLIIQKSKAPATPLPPVCGKPERATATCSAMRWDAAKVKFVADIAGTRRWCR